MGRTFITFLFALQNFTLVNTVLDRFPPQNYHFHSICTLSYWLASLCMNTWVEHRKIASSNEPYPRNFSNVKKFPILVSILLAWSLLDYVLAFLGPGIVFIALVEISFSFYVFRCEDPIEHQKCRSFDKFTIAIIY